jgi:hypothetical protein
MNVTTALAPPTADYELSAHSLVFLCNAHAAATMCLHHQCLEHVGRCCAVCVCCLYVVKKGQINAYKQNQQKRRVLTGARGDCLLQTRLPLFCARALALYEQRVYGVRRGAVIHAPQICSVCLKVHIEREIAL